MINEANNVTPQETQTVTVEKQTVVNDNKAAVPAEKPESAQESVKTEKLYTKDEVAKIANAEKLKEAEKVRQETRQQYEQEALKRMQEQQSQVASGQVDGNAPLTRNDLIKLQQEEVQRTQQALIKDIQGTFTQRLDAFRKEDPAFDKEVLETMPATMLENIPLLHGINGLDNAADVLKEMAARPSKYDDIQAAARNNPQWGLKKLYELSASIKANKEALKNPIANPPLDQIKPSPTGKDSGKLTVAQMRKLPQYRV